MLPSGIIKLKQLKRCLIIYSADIRDLSNNKQSHSYIVLHPLEIAIKKSK